MTLIMFISNTSITDNSIPARIDSFKKDSFHLVLCWSPPAAFQHPGCQVTTEKQLQMLQIPTV